MAGQEGYEPPTDHTGGTMRCRWRLIGAHVHCVIFGPYSGKAGELTFWEDEWPHFRRTHPHWAFQRWEDQ